MLKKAVTEFDLGKNRETGLLYEAYEWVGIISFVVVFIVLLFLFVFREIGVIGNSMLNTLHDGDRIIVYTMNYKPKDNDIVVMYSDKLKKTLIKRVIAVEGQKVYIDYTAHRVYVDGELRDEPYIKEETAFMGETPVSMPTTVPPDCVFVMGDNRNNSIDSRSSEVGMIKNNLIIGKAILCYFPVRDMKLL
jgi:signal peptidase I